MNIFIKMLRIMWGYREPCVRSDHELPKRLQLYVLQDNNRHLDPTTAV